MYGNSLHLSLLYNINQKYTVGVGLGMDRYEPAPNTLPIFATFRYRPFVKPNLSDFYAFTNLGYAVSSKDDFDLTSGFMGDFGIGWSKMFYKHFGINLQIAYNLKQFRFPTLDYIVDDYVYYEPTLIKISQWRHSLSFGVGLVF
jgi:hypothetical protein